MLECKYDIIKIYLLGTFLLDQSKDERYLVEDQSLSQETTGCRL